MAAGKNKAKGALLDISDMDIAFDNNGKIMKVTKVDANKLGNNGRQYQEVVKQELNDDLTEVVKSEVMQKL